MVKNAGGWFTVANEEMNVSVRKTKSLEDPSLIHPGDIFLAIISQGFSFYVNIEMLCFKVF